MTAQDPALLLLALHQKQHAAYIAACYSATSSDADTERLSDIANKTWWRMLDTAPETLAGAVAIAEWVAELEAQELAPNLRHRTEESEENVVLIALNRVLQLYHAAHNTLLAVAAE